MGKYKIKKQIDEELSRIKAKMLVADPAGTEYGVLYERYCLLIEERNALDPQQKSGWDKGVEILKIGVGVLAGVAVPIVLAQEAHKEDSEMLLSNGRIWSIAQKTAGNVKEGVENRLSSSSGIFRSQIGKKKK